MKIDEMASKQIATTLAKHYDSVFYVENETGRYVEFVTTQMLKDLEIPEEPGYTAIEFEDDYVSEGTLWPVQNRIF